MLRPYTSGRIIRPRKRIVPDRFSRIANRNGRSTVTLWPTLVRPTPTEVAAAAGTGRTFAQGRASMDVGIERLERRGTGLTERVWTVLLGITVRP